MPVDHITVATVVGAVIAGLKGLDVLGDWLKGKINHGQPSQTVVVSLDPEVSRQLAETHERSGRLVHDIDRMSDKLDEVRDAVVFKNGKNGHA